MPFITASTHVIARNVYDFAVDGGAVSTIALRGDKIPSGAIITSGLIVVKTVLTSGGAATVGISTEAASDLQSAAAVSGAPWSTATPKRTTLTATGAPIQTTAERTPSAVIAAAALTAGKFVVYTWYIVEAA
jgi:hypothetical protein